ncbi:dimethylamine:proton symporter, ABT family [Dethiosulfatibacter aminovorans DSM 17477]|uniref:Dimethylamine:proton symporter, ABT family n=1 Tax=Dethiosulfatibacter aminovorans DSM 17477 TaxID=1121476 RepID=A0A1M6HZB7_9FIRM|nr:APC family permease [Dethiosulfatibacter aminovorans]SHJ27513.1 dimethylamine:proton symporter, ABT family [Dethiosulfatibacter aminovorans DSM 17477]
MENKLQRNIDWKQGLSIALGVPLLIMPSIVYFTSYMYAFSILVWAISVGQGFFQNLAYAEMAVDFPDASGLPGYSQKILKSGGNRYSDFIGGFSAWSYWFAWSPILAIFTLSIKDFAVSVMPVLGNYPDKLVTLIIGTLIFFGMHMFNRKGLESGAVVGYILNIVSLLPLIVLAVAPFALGRVDMANITNNWMPADFTLDVKNILVIFGIFGMAQWSACAWETAAVYGPEYKDPKRDVVKALFSCGAICMVIFVLVQTVCIGLLGVDGVINSTEPPILTIAKMTFGSTGGIMSSIMLVAAMLMIIQTGFLGASRAMHSMASTNSLPKIFSRTNEYGVPVNAMISIIILNYGLIMLKSPSAILAASSLGYALANGISLYSYVKYKREKNNKSTKSGKENTKGLRVPRLWDKVIIAFAFVNIPLFLVGLVYLNSLDSGWSSTIVGVGVLALYVPLYKYSEKEKNMTNLTKTG